MDADARKSRRIADKSSCGNASCASAAPQEKQKHVNTKQTRLASSSNRGIVTVALAKCKVIAMSTANSVANIAQYNGYECQVGERTSCMTAPSPNEHKN